MKKFSIYLISKKGAVFTSHGGFRKRKIPIHKGYVYGRFRINGKYKSLYVHRIVAQLYLKNPKNYKEVNHKNGIKYDNRVSNLEWCNKRQNMNHAFTDGHKKYGVTWSSEKNKWRSQIKLNGKNKFLGYFKAKNEAHTCFFNAYVEAYGVPPWKGKKCLM